MFVPSSALGPATAVWRKAQDAAGAARCWFGMNARGGTEGVGQAATSGVVVSIFVVLVADVVLVKVIQLVF